MASPRVYSRSFTGGEVTPEFFGRIDDVKHATGLARCRNFVIKPHGPAENRAGFEMVREVADSTKRARVIPFVFADGQNYAIELGAGYFRFHIDGATLMAGSVPYEIANSYAEADIPAIKYVQSNDVVTLTHTNYPPSELRRESASAWAFTSINFDPVLPAPTQINATATPAATSPGAPTVQSYVVTAVAGAEESIASSDALSGAAAITNITQANPCAIYVQGASTPFAPGDEVFVSGVGGMSELNHNYYVVTSATYSGPVPLPFGGTIPGYSTIHIEDSGGTPVDSSAFSAYSGGGTIAIVGAARCSNNLYDDGAYNTIVWQGVTGAERYYVYKLSNGLYGFIGQTEGYTFTDDNITADISRTPPVADNPFTGAGEYPGAVSYFEQRRCFGGSRNKPANFVSTKSGTETNLNYSIPGRDDDSVRFRIAARERNTIRHIVPMANLVLLTESCEWRVAPAEGEVLTPNVSLRPQSFIGAADAQPVIVNNNLLFAAARGGHVRELAYNWQANGYITGDVSLRAPHLFDGGTIVELAYAKAPIPIVWAVNSYGLLLGLTYVPEQEVGAWHRHDTRNGVFESIAVVPEGNDDVLYAVVRRQIGGQTRRFIERMRSRYFGASADGFFVDCGMTYRGAAANVISGLDHLEGETVSVLADGKDLGDMVVTGGTLTLPVAAEVVHAGLPITADLMTLPLAFEGPAYGQGRPKNINKVWMRVAYSRNMRAGSSFETLYPVKQRDTEVYGSPPALDTGEYEVALRGEWGPYGQVCIRQDRPLPLTVVSLTTEFAVGG